VLVDRSVLPPVGQGITNRPGLPVHRDHGKFPAAENLVTGTQAFWRLHK
jgi:hypothetical protein